MSERIDRRIGNNWLLGGFLGILVLAAAGIVLWNGTDIFSLSHPVEGEMPESDFTPSDEPLTLLLYYPVNGALAPRSAPMKRQPDTQAQAREVLNALFSLEPPDVSEIFSQIKLREFFLEASGTAYVDLSAGPAGISGSIREELLTLYSIADTLMLNFEEIRHVRFLIDGKDAQTLAGHIDISGNFEKRMDLVKQ